MRLKLLYHWRRFWAGLQKPKPVQKSACLVVAAVFKNEAPFLKEWLDFHLAQGVERFYLADNHSTDQPVELLQPYLEKGLVYLTRTETAAMNARIQAQVLNELLSQVSAKESIDTWVAVIDVDEFLFNPEGHSIHETLRGFEGKEVAAVVANWLMFGTSNLKQLNPQQSMLEQLRMRAHASLGEHKMVKPILYIANQAGFIEGPHTPICKGKASIYYSDQSPFDSNRPKIIHKPLRINHYWYRSEDYYNQEKRHKRRAFGDERSGQREADHIKACNYEEDRSILKLWP